MTSADGLGVKAAGVDLDEQGFVVTDKHLATTAPGIYAAGDVTGLFGHTHAAYAMGRVAVGSALRRVRRPTFRPAAMPQVVFTAPDIVTVGLLDGLGNVGGGKLHGATIVAQRAAAQFFGSYGGRTARRVRRR